VLGEPPRLRRGVLETLAAIYALIGGSIATFGGLSPGALATGLAVTFGLAILTALRSKAPRAFGIMMAYSFAFAMLTWPVLLFVAYATT
jgi:Ca2+/H+ antiporter